MCSILGVFDLRPGADLHPLRPLALSLSAALCAPIEPTRFGVFRM